MADRAKSEEITAELDERLMEAELRMDRAIEAFHKELGAIRAGRATPALVDRIQVEVYGSHQPLQSVATIQAPEPRLLVIKPFDPSTIGAIEKGLSHSQLGLTPSNDGQVIRIAIPPLTEERRREFGKIVKGKAEETRVSIRNTRRDEVEHLRRVEKDGHISKDEVESRVSDVQKLTDRFVTRVDDIATRKEAELLEV